MKAKRELDLEKAKQAEEEKRKQVLVQLQFSLPSLTGLRSLYTVTAPLFVAYIHNLFSQCTVIYTPTNVNASVNEPSFLWA